MKLSMIEYRYLIKIALKYHFLHTKRRNCYYATWGLSNLMHSVILLPGMTSYDTYNLKCVLLFVGVFCTFD